MNLESVPLQAFLIVSSILFCIAELIFSSYQRAFFSKKPFLGAATARAGNVIGGGDYAKDRIIPDAIRAWIKNKPVVIRHPESTRPWQHVIEPTFGYINFYLYISINLELNYG